MKIYIGLILVFQIIAGLQGFYNEDDEIHPAAPLVYIVVHVIAVLCLINM